MPRETEEELFRRLTRDARAEARREQQRDLERRRQRKLERRQKREDAARREQQEEIISRQGRIDSKAETSRRGIMARPRKKMVCLPADVKMETIDLSGDGPRIFSRRDSGTVMGFVAPVEQDGVEDGRHTSVEAAGEQKVSDSKPFDLASASAKDRCGRGIMSKPRKKMCVSILNEVEMKVAEMDRVAQSASVPARRSVGTVTDPLSPRRLLARVDAAVARHMHMGNESEHDCADEVQIPARRVVDASSVRDGCQPEISASLKETEVGTVTDWEEAWRQALTEEDRDGSLEVLAAWAEHMS